MPTSELGGVRSGVGVLGVAALMTGQRKGISPAYSLLHNTVLLDKHMRGPGTSIDRQTLRYHNLWIRLLVVILDTTGT